MSFDTRPKPDREAVWVHCEMHRSRMGHTTTNRAGLAGGSVAIRTITILEVIDDYSRLLLKKSAMDISFTLGSTKEAENVKILQSCNGLLLCSGSRRPVFDYIYNPSTNQFKRLSHPVCSLDNSPYYRSAGLRMVFDPTKSPHYKLVDAGRTSCDIDIQIYSSEIGNRSLYRDCFNYFSFDHFDSAIYWNDDLHWLETKNMKLTHYRLDIENHKHPIITTIQIPQRGMNFLESYSYMDPMLILIQIPHLLHLKWKLFESRGCLLLVCRDDIGSSEFTIYEMMKWYSVWSVRYRVDTDNFMTRLPKGWSIRSTVWSIVLGEKEKDSLLVINLFGNVDTVTCVVGARCFDLDLGARCFDLLDGTTRVVQIAAFQELDPGLPL
ncbi:hypothetical protein Tco_0740911 [Tanacetum coccineum]